jgi:superoxide dismutase, Cu-Zn family
MLRLKSLVLTAGVGLIAAGCCENHHDKAAATSGAPHHEAVLAAAEMGPEIKEAVAVLHGTTGNEKVMGVIRFSDTGSGVKVSGEIMGLEANSKHGFHVHEFGDCSDMAKATSAGGHYNPDGHQHGGPGAMAHVGDMGNLEADAAGTAKVDITLPNATLTGKNAILGRGVILHAKADDLKSQPAGNSGDRIACAVIGVAQVKK